MTESSSLSTDKPTHYDAIIIGSGQAGNPLAVALSDKGMRTAMIECAAIGGTCVNYGCTPTKTMVASAELAYQGRRAAEYGIRLGEVSVDMAAVRERKRGVVRRWREGSEKRLETAQRVEVMHGEASFSGPKQVRVRLNAGGERTLFSDLIVIDTGLTASIPAIPGMDAVPYLDNVSIMELGEVPEHLLVMGGGYIGLEFGQMFRRFGSRVTIAQHGKQLLTGEDEDIADAIAAILKEDGIEILLEATPHSVSSSDGKLHLVGSSRGQAVTLEGTHLLVATGVIPTPKSSTCKLQAWPRTTAATFA